jgi:hypothetical protein
MVSDRKAKARAYRSGTTKRAGEVDAAMRNMAAKVASMTR